MATTPADNTQATPPGMLLNPESAVSPEDVKLMSEGTALEQTPKDPPDEEVDDDAELEAGAKRDTELEAAATDEERAKIREERKLARKSRQQRAKDRNERQQREIDGLKETARQLQQTVVSLQNHTLGQTLSQVDKEIETSSRVMQEAAAIEAEALTKGDGRTAVQAREAGLEARQRVLQLKTLKDRAVQQANRPAPLDPTLERNAKAWKEKNNWYNPASADDDSAILTALDNSVAKAGFDPRTEAYWNELDARVAKHLPHRVQKGHNGGSEGSGGAAAGSGGSPVAGASGSGLAASAGAGSANGSGGAGYTLSAARVQAIKDAGLWDDPAGRAKMIKRYKEHDAQQRH